MSMVKKEKDLIGFAHKVISFRMNVIKACKTKGIMPPTDEQISDYINNYGLNFEDFMTDFTEHEGMFRCLRTSLEDFKAEINSIQWGNKPTDDEIVAFFNKNGNNIEMFCNQHTIKNMNHIERKTYLKTIEKLSEEKLVKLWNTFIGESALYDEDSYIYDLESQKDCNFLGGRMTPQEIKYLTSLNTRYVQWFSLNGNSIKGRTDENIKRIITAYWGEIFERIMLYPSAYNFDVEVFCKGDASTYFDDVFFPVIAKEIGYIVDGDKGTIKKIEK